SFSPPLLWSPFSRTPGVNNPPGSKGDPLETKMGRCLHRCCRSGHRCRHRCRRMHLGCPPSRTIGRGSTSSRHCCRHSCCLRQAPPGPALLLPSLLTLLFFKHHGRRRCQRHSIDPSRCRWG
ncbi:unnamed protein product, partial [Ectocarpus sp. 4 AP-2014]